MLIGLIILLTLGVFIGNLQTRYLVTRGKPEQELAKQLGPRYGEMLSYNWLELPAGVKVVKVNFYEKEFQRLPVFNGSNENDTFEKIIDSVDFVYDARQSNPKYLFTLGGNCQAVSLYLRDTFEKNGFSAGLVVDDGLDHMYDWVKVGNKKYKVDLVKKIVEEI